MARIGDYLTEPGWRAALRAEFDAPYFRKLEDTLEEQTDGFYPPTADIFAAFNLTPLETVKVVIIGQDPYHGAGQAMGLSFSVAEGVPVPPSLRNMKKEIAADLGSCAISAGDLTPWAAQGVLMLNSSLTVADGKPGGHSGYGWQTFTDAAIRHLCEVRPGVVFMLWGKHAQVKARSIDAARHRLLSAPHPSPLSAYRGFFGCGHFSAANQFLSEQGESPILW